MRLEHRPGLSPIRELLQIVVDLLSEKPDQICYPLWSESANIGKLLMIHFSFFSPASQLIPPLIQGVLF